MTTTLKHAATACLFAAFVAGTLAPRLASAAPEAPGNLRVEGVAGLSHTAAAVSWDEPLNARTVIRTVTRSDWESRSFREYWITLRTTPLPSAAGTVDRCIDRRSAPAPRGCIRRSYSVPALIKIFPQQWLDPPVWETNPLSRQTSTVHDLTPGTTYYVHVANIFNASGKTYAGAGTTTTFTTTAAPGGTPTEPETPGTDGACTYEHRIVGVPGTTTGGYTGRVWVSSKAPNATATIRAYQGDNGHPLDVLDKEGSAVESVTLAPANSIQRFRTEDAQGWHVVTVTHPTARAMHAASVVLRVRGPDGVQIVPIPPAEHCEPATATAE